MFRQEYPASPGEAFLHSGTGVFDNEQIVLRLERLPSPAGRGEFTDGEWTESETGAITLYELPEEGVPYVLGGDTAGEGSDYFTAIVIDNVSGRIVAKLRQKYSEPEHVQAPAAVVRDAPAPPLQLLVRQLIGGLEIPLLRRPFRPRHYRH